MLSLVGGVVVLPLVSTFALHSFLFLPGVISGIIVILSGVMLYERPNGHSLWSGLVIAVAVVDLLGVMFFLSAPAPQARPPTLIASVGPLLALLGGVEGLAWKPRPILSTAQSLS